MTNATNYTGRTNYLWRIGKFLSLLLILVSCNFFSFGQTIWYVKASATGLNNGGNWADAFTDLQPAIDAFTASTASDKQIWVAAGTYKPTQIAGNGTQNRDKSFAIGAYINLYGGFAGTEPANYDLTLRNVHANETILSGDIGITGDNSDNSYHVFIITGPGGRLDGFTLTDGNANGTASPITFQGQDFERSYCGGIYCRQMINVLTIANCSVEGNSGSNYGGIYSFSSNPYIINCIIRNNIATGRGNNTGGAGGLSSRNSTLTAVNCLITGNKGDDGGGIGQAGLCSNTYINCTISGNTALGSGAENNDNAQGGAINNYGFSTAQVYNCIVWGNTAREGNNLYNDPNSTFFVLNSIIEGGFTGGVGNIDADPLFVNPVAAISAPTVGGDYHISCNSPAINSANNGSYPSAVPLIDLDGNERIVGAIIDMGSYEYQITPTQNIIIQSIVPGSPFSYCPGAAIAINFSINNCPGNFNAGNIFTLQLSDAGGSFSSPVSIGSLTSTSGGTINAIIPANTPSGNGYRLRIVSSSQAFTSEVFNVPLNILSNQPPAIIISASAAQICAADNVIFNSVTTNGGTNPVYQWKKNGNAVGTNSNSYSDNGLTGADVITCELINTQGCASPASAVSNAVVVAVNDVTPAISISVDNPNICSDQTATFTATISGGGNNPSFQWKKNGTNIGTNSSSCSFSGLLSTDIITCELFSNATCANPQTVLSNPLQVIVTSVVIPTVTISADKNEICPGDPVTFNALVINSGTNPVVQWKKNGVNAGTNNMSYTDATLSGIDIITCEMQSNAACASPQTVMSNPISVIVNVVTPIITIRANKDAMCAGETATFNATISGGGSSPSYQWQKNGVNVGANSPVWSDVSLASTDIITCKLTSNYGCVSQPTVESNTMTISVNPVPQVTVTKSNDINCTTGQARLTAIGGVKFEWEPAPGLENRSVPNPVVHPSQTTTYEVKVTTDKNCSNTGHITVSVSPSGKYEIPNSFTPNGDGKNDCFGAGYMLNLSKLDLSIYNRWGQRIFHTSNPSHCWDGKYGGKDQSADVYIYVIKGIGDCGILEKKGHVLLLR